MRNGGDLSVEHRQIGEVGTIVAEGTVDMRTLPGFREAVEALLAHGARHLVIDLRGVSYIDSAGISVLLSAKRGVFGSGGKVFVAVRPGEVQLALHIVQIDRVVTIVDTPEEALAALDAEGGEKG